MSVWKSSFMGSHYDGLRIQGKGGFGQSNGAVVNGVEKCTDESGFNTRRVNKIEKGGAEK